MYKNKEIVSLENGGRSFDSLVTLVNEHLEGKSSDATENENNSNEPDTLKKDEGITTENDMEDKSIDKDLGSDEIIIKNVATEDEDEVKVKGDVAKDEL